MIDRYQRNKNTISEAEQIILAGKKAAVIGCGGLGAYIAEMLCRMGVGELSLVDYDVIDPGNLNRQIISHTQNIGLKKVFELEKRLILINPDIRVKALDAKFSGENAHEILKGADIVMDALDTVTDRILLKEECKKYHIPLIHGAIAGLYGQVSVIFPGDNTLDKIYPDTDMKPLEKELGNPSFTPACIASIQVAECLKVLLNKGYLLRHKLLIINLLNMEFDCIDLA